MWSLAQAWSASPSPPSLLSKSPLLRQPLMQTSEIDESGD
jgi:hypothetical protein